MACKCSPSLVRLMADFARRGHINSGCCGDAAHQARKSDHNPDESGYAHAQDVHEKNDHDMKPFVDFIMANPAKYPQVKYLIYERVIYYPHAAGSRRPGAYAYTGPNAHAAHLHVSIFSTFTHYAGDWLVAEAYRPQNDPKAQPSPLPQEDPYMRLFIKKPDNPAVYEVHADHLEHVPSEEHGAYLIGGTVEEFRKRVDTKPDDDPVWQLLVLSVVGTPAPS